MPWLHRLLHLRCWGKTTAIDDISGRVLSYIYGYHLFSYTDWPIPIINPNTEALFLPLSGITYFPKINQHCVILCPYMYLAKGGCLVVDLTFTQSYSLVIGDHTSSEAVGISHISCVHGEFLTRPYSTSGFCQTHRNRCPEFFCVSFPTIWHEVNTV